MTPPSPARRRTARGRLRAALAVLFVGAGVAHFVVPHVFTSIVPPGLPAPGLLVALSGAAEVAGGLGLLGRRTRRLAAWGLVALLVAVFPANVYLFARDLAALGWTAYTVLLLLRLPLQAVLVAAVLAARHP